MAIMITGQQGKLPTTQRQRLEKSAIKLELRARKTLLETLDKSTDLQKVKQEQHYWSMDPPLLS